MATSTVRLAAAGDTVAFARIVAAYHADMVRVAYVVAGGDQDLADDAVQAAWSIAWRKLGSLRDPERLKPWLVSVAANEARQLCRRRRRASVVEIDVAVDDPGRARPGRAGRRARPRARAPTPHRRRAGAPRPALRGRPRLDRDRGARRAARRHHPLAARPTRRPPPEGALRCLSSIPSTRGSPPRSTPSRTAPRRAWTRRPWPHGRSAADAPAPFAWLWSPLPVPAGLVLTLVVAACGSLPGPCRWERPWDRAPRLSPLRRRPPRRRRLPHRRRPPRRPPTEGRRGRQWDRDRSPS